MTCLCQMTERPTDASLSSCPDHKYLAKAVEPDLLSGTEIFMREAGQLSETPVLFDRTVTLGSERDLHLREVIMLRHKLIREEYQEYLDANENHGPDGLVEMLDAWLDIIVVTWGSVLAYVGPDIAKQLAAEVTRSNLSKVIGPGLPIFREDNKVIKPSGWTGPNIRGILEEAGLL